MIFKSINYKGKNIGITKIININIMKTKTVGGYMSVPQFLLLFLSVVLISIISPVLIFPQFNASIIQNSNLSEYYKKAIENELKNAINDGIPENLLESRIREGIAKGAGGEKILQVLVNEIQLMKKARLILLSIQGGKRLLKDEASWARTANLLSAGISEEEIKTIVKACQKRWSDYRSATYLYASLIRWKLSREKSLKIIEAVLESSLKSDDFIGIIEILIEGRRLRIHPENMAERIIEILPYIDNTEKLKEKILYINQ